MPIVTQDFEGWMFDHLAAKLRQADVDELYASSGSLPGEALAHAVDHSEHLRVVLGDDGTPFAVYGKVPHPDEPDVAAPWMVATDDVAKYRVWMFRGFAPHINACQGNHNFWNYVDARNTLHMQWLRFHDFQFVHLHPHHGHLGLPFWEFIRDVRSD